MPTVSAYFLHTSEAVQFINGFTKGLTGEDLGQDFEQCLAESTGIIEELEDAIDTFTSGDITGAVNGIFKLVHFIDQLPQVLSDCKQISVTAMQKLIAFAAKF
jgi:hypothetical protein